MKRFGYFYCCAWNWIHLKQPPVECFCFTIILIFPGQFHIGPRVRGCFWPLMTFLLMTTRSHLLIRSRTFQENVCTDLLFSTEANTIQFKTETYPLHFIMWFYEIWILRGGGSGPHIPPLDPRMEGTSNLWFTLTTIQRNSYSLHT